MKILTIIISTVLIQFAYGLTQAERDAVVQAHNNYRSQLAKGQTILQNSNNAQSAKNLYKLTYNTSIESVAQAWADQCNVEHSSGSEFGENLYYISDGEIALADALTNASAYWWGELNTTGGLYYQNGFAYANQSELEEIGDAIQMAWAKTTQIGCGAQHCSSYTFVVCNYYQPGNLNCAPVYEVGPACAADNQCTSFPSSTCEVSSGLCQVEATSYYSNDPSNAMASTNCETSTTTTLTATTSTTTTSASTATTVASTATIAASTATTAASTATTSTSPPQCASCTANLPTLITGSVTPYIYMNPTFIPDAGNPNSGNCRTGIMCNGTNLSLIVNGTVNGNTSTYGYQNNGNNVTIQLDCWNYTTTWYFLNNAAASVNSVSCQVNAADFAPETQLMVDAPRSAHNDAALVQIASAKKEYGYKKVPKAKKSAMQATNANTNIKQK